MRGTAQRPSRRSLALAVFVVSLRPSDCFSGRHQAKCTTNRSTPAIDCAGHRTVRRRRTCTARMKLHRFRTGSDVNHPADDPAVNASAGGAGPASPQAFARCVVVYDGQCPFCTRGMERIRRRDRRQCFTLLPSQTPDLLTRFPRLAEHDLSSGLRVILPTGEVRVGADAVFEISRRLPGWRWIAWLYRVPPVKTVARWCYRWTAVNRRRLGGRSG